MKTSHVLVLIASFLFAEAALGADKAPDISWGGKLYPARDLGATDATTLISGFTDDLMSSYVNLACGFTLGNFFTGPRHDSWRGSFEAVLGAGSPALDKLIAPDGHALRVINPKGAFNPVIVATPLATLAEMEKLTRSLPGTLYKDYTFVFLVEKRRFSYAFGLGCQEALFVENIIPVGAKLDTAAVAANFREQVDLGRKMLTAACVMSKSTHPVCLFK